jgi:hypothetical protein
LDETGFIQGSAIIGGGILAAAIGVMDQARRGPLSLDGHGQGSDGEFGAQMIAHPPSLLWGLGEDQGRGAVRLCSRTISKVGYFRPLARAHPFGLHRE